MNIALTTFGSSSGAIILAELLNKLNDKRMTNKICSTIATFDYTLNQLKSIKNKRVMRKIAFLWETETKKKIEKLNIPDEIKHFTFNVESTIYKKFVRSTL